MNIITENTVHRTSTAHADLTETVIEPSGSWRMVDLAEIANRRDLLWNLTWRNIKGRYAQSALGMGWVLVQPLVSLMIYSLIFGRVVRIKPPGGIPYAVYAFCGLVPWLYFSGAMSAAAGSILGSTQLITKVYFPRLVLPLSNVLGRLIDLGATLLVLAVLMAWHGIVPRPSAIVVLPMLVIIATAAALGVGLCLAAMAVQYRDVAHSLGFLVQIWMYLSPVVYPASFVPERYRLIYALNPMVGVISGFRAVLLRNPAIPWDQIAIAAVVSLLLLVGGAFYFRRSERLFADVA
jgi:lipopolysaccharide transport system permease protein